MATGQTSDIIVDVTRAPDTLAVDAARIRLRQVAQGSQVREPFTVPGAVSARIEGAEPRSRTPEVFVKFEAMVLQTFLQSMLPEDGEAVYGEGLAGQMWKSFLAKEVGTQMAKAGGIGIADRILADFYRTDNTKVVGSDVAAGAGNAQADTQGLLSTALVQEIQRNITRAIDEDLAVQGRATTP